MNRKTGHVSYVFKQHDKDINSLGFTHNKNDKANKQLLIHNINPRDDSPCFVKTKVEKQKFNDYRYSDKYKDYRIHNDDKQLFFWFDK